MRSRNNQEKNTRRKDGALPPGENFYTITSQSYDCGSETSKNLLLLAGLFAFTAFLHRAGAFLALAVFTRALAVTAGAVFALVAARALARLRARTGLALAVFTAAFALAFAGTVFAGIAAVTLARLRAWAGFAFAAFALALAAAFAGTVFARVAAVADAFRGGALTRFFARGGGHGHENGDSHEERNADRRGAYDHFFRHINLL